MGEEGRKEGMKEGRKEGEGGKKEGRKKGGRKERRKRGSEFALWSETMNEILVHGSTMAANYTNAVISALIVVINQRLTCI